MSFSISIYYFVYVSRALALVALLQFLNLALACAIANVPPNA
jgi:hypothetical protein